MQIANGSLVPIYRVLDNLIDRTDFPPNTKHAILFNHSRLEEEVRRFEQIRQEIVTRHAAKDEDGEVIVDDSGQPTFEGDSESEAMDELQELLDKENYIDVREMSIEPLLENQGVSGREILAIEDLLSDSSLDEG